ncbi:MAG: hypothetical protein IPI48_18750 [bacterium]|nr:hypothetical protein [bacterium]
MIGHTYRNIDTEQVLNDTAIFASAFEGRFLGRANLFVEEGAGRVMAIDVGITDLDDKIEHDPETAARWMPPGRAGTRDSGPPDGRRLHRPLINSSTASTSSSTWNGLVRYLSTPFCRARSKSISFRARGQKMIGRNIVTGRSSGAERR